MTTTKDQITRTPDHGYLMNYATGEAIRAATADERRDSVEASATDGGVGAFTATVNGAELVAYVED